MSQWATLEARFSGEHVGEWLVADGLPTGSESGPSVSQHDGAWHVDGRLRDVSDLDAPAALAWFARVCEHGIADEADMMWDLDSGPRYRYEWRAGELRKLRGVLD